MALEQDGTPIALEKLVMSKSGLKSSSNAARSKLPALPSLAKSENKKASKRGREVQVACICPTSIVVDDPWSDARTTFLQLVPKTVEVVRKTKTQRGPQFRTDPSPKPLLWNTATPILDRRTIGILSTFEVANRLLSESSNRGNCKSPQAPTNPKREADDVGNMSGLISSLLVGALFVLLVSSTLALLVAPKQREQVEERLFSQVLSHISVEQ